MEGDLSGVRIIPSLIEFKDSEVSNVLRVNVTVKNVGKSSKSIRYYGPQTECFHLKVKNPEQPIAPGLEVPAIVEYKAEDNQVHKDRLVVTVDGEVIEIPLCGYPCQPDLVLQGTVSFGNVLAKSKVISKEIPLYNNGSKAGDFKIKYSGSKPISVIPSSGTVLPHSKVIIKIEYVTKEPGKFAESAKVKLEGKETSNLKIYGNVVAGSLKLLSYETEEELSCIKFGSAYYGTDKTESAILFNNGPEPVSFVTLLDEDAPGMEVGVDLSNTTTGDTGNQEGTVNDLTSLVTAIPNQGMLASYEKIPIFFRFSPRWIESKQGFKATQKDPPRRDYALFLQLKILGSSGGFQEGDSTQNTSSDTAGSCLEIALTATALPVQVTLSPQNKYNFGECPMGEHVDALCTLKNESPSLMANFQFRRVAHYTSHPANGKISPGESRDVIFSFAPNQVGTFKLTQYMDVIGQVADNCNPFLMNQQVIRSIPIQFVGQADPVTVKKAPVFNPGITPKITNEVGMYVDTTTMEAKKNPRAALLNAQNTKLHRLKRSMNTKSCDSAKVAFPNDRAQSIRPSNRTETYKTIFTQVDRHTYVDPDYAYTDEEAEALQAHKDYYIKFIDDLRQNRKNKIQAQEFTETNNNTDLAMKPAAGLKPKKLTVDQAKPDPRPATPPNANFKLLSTKQLASVEMQNSVKFKDGLNAVPSTSHEKTDCKKILSPQELHQVIIGPPSIDFGSVCLRSVSRKDLNIVNNLETHIHVVVKVDCRELRQTSPLSQVVPPKSKATLPLIFESNMRGTFQRSLDYSVNGFYKNHVTVFAEVVPVSLQLSTTDLVLEPSIGLPAEAGIRGVIYLRNKLNHMAEFTWTPILGERGTAFSIRPATGTVDSHTELACEVVFHPSFLAPENGSFALQVHGGNALKLNCSAKLGSPGVQFIDRRIMFGQVPLHLTTMRMATLKNNSVNHAYFQVLDPNPFPGLSVGPIHGVVPVGGVAELQVQLTPNEVRKFDTHIQVAIRGCKTLELRMGGTVEPPCVEIDLPNFQFGGVFCGSSAATPFKLINKVNTKTRVDFDLSRYADFTLDFPGEQNPEDMTFQLMNPGLYTVTVEGGDTIEGILLFKPTEVASYDFVMPVTINQTGAPTPAPTPCPPTPAASNKNSLQHIINPRPVQVTVTTPRKKILATALRQPLQMSHNSLEFTLSAMQYAMADSSSANQSKGTLLVNNSDRELKWCVDISHGNQVLESGVFKFLHSSGMPFMSHGESGVEGILKPGQTQSLGILFCPSKPGFYQVTVPIILDDDFAHPYQFLTLSGEVQAPKLWFDPLAIVLTPVPLQTEVSAELCVLATNYIKHSSVSVEVPEVESEDGSKIAPLSVTFPQGQEIKPCCGKEGEVEPFILPCKVTFQSAQPISFSEPLVFVDDIGNRFHLPVTATADNCLLTCYPFLAQHRGDHQIVVEQGVSLRGRVTASRESENVGEAILVPCSPPRPSSRRSTTATSSSFEVSSSSYEHSSESVSDSTYRSSPREGALNKITANSEDKNHGRTGLASRSLGSALFPEEDTEEGVFHTEVLLAVQRWFSSQGWPGGPHPINIPYSLRSGICKMPSDEKARTSKGRILESNNLKKEFKTVYDMVAHLCGRQVPGIPLNNPLPSNPLERAKQVYWQHSTLLTFIKTQGACVASVKPEYLMDPRDYKNWVVLQKGIEAAKHSNGHYDMKLKTEEEEAIEDQLFEAVSKRAWTDVLLQLLKTLLLAKITPRQFKNMTTPFKNSSVPTIDPDPRCSNVYSIGERIVLLWLNHNYEQGREHIWKDCPRGDVPPSRWIVNFDFDLLDGLVLAGVLGTHVPFLIQTHLREMYTHPATAEQCLHNALLVVNALRHIGLDYDIQAIDITDPNPVSLMLLCVHLYNHLPQYISKSMVDFVGGLHAMVLRQVRLSNPSSKPLTYQAMIAGQDACDFSLPKGNTVTLGPKSTQNLSIEFVSRFLRPAEATLVMVGRRQGSSVGITLVFNLRTQIDNIAPKTIIRCESPCYELHRIPMNVTNPFPREGEFRIILVESTSDFPGMGAGSETGLAKKFKKKPKKISSRIDHGKSKPEISEVEQEPENFQATKSTTDDSCKPENLLKGFFCPSPSAHLEAGGTAVVEVHFLPFQTGKRQCSVIFVNQEIGEFLYSIEAQTTLPLPAVMPFQPTTNSVRISSAAAAGGGRGMFGGDERVIYWKCQCGQELQENITVPINNEARGRALITASQQYMSESELERRAVTGTLTSATVTARTLELLSTGSTAKVKESLEGKRFTVEINSEYFSCPVTLVLPSPKQAETSVGDTVAFPVTFLADKPGHYPCQVVLRCQDDVRVYNIECTVTPEGSEAQIEMTSPVHQPVSQDIPIVNGTNHDWPIRAVIDGTGFVGPTTMLAKAHQTSQYPLMFQPKNEGNVLGKLVLINTTDKVEHTFHLLGKGERPLPLEKIKVECQAKEKVTRTVHIPNVTKKKLHYRVESDMTFISGLDYVSVLSGKTGEYSFTLNPRRGGHFKGILSFVATSNPVTEIDSDGDEIPEDEDDELRGYRVWFSLDVHVQPPKPEDTLNITCACHKKAILEVGLNNPTDQELKVEAVIKAEQSGLLGPAEITLPPASKGVYSLTYAPAIIGSSKGSLIFYNDAVGEFWYALNLTAEKPVPTLLPNMECELGRWARQVITLHNPTDEVLQLIPTNSNTNNFKLQRDNERPIELRPHTSLQVPITFMPSTMGEGDHKATIIFHCEQLGEWIFEMRGSGLLPQPQDPVSITALAGSNSTLIIPFRNPMDIPVQVDVVLTDKEQLTQRVLTNSSSEDSPFCLLLKCGTGLRLGPKSNLDVPVSFAPEDMRMFEAMLAVIVRKEDGSSWHYVREGDAGSNLPRTMSGGIHEIRWLYPIHGFPELTSKDSQPAVVECRARERIEERLEVTLSGVAPSAGGPKRGITARALTPAGEQPKLPEGVVVGETLAVAEEFTYEIVHADSDSENILDPAVALNLVRQHRDNATGLMVLVFNVVYAPYNTMLHHVQLLVRGTTGGQWRFPICFIATEPEPDDAIIIEASGLNQESFVGFRLTSQARHPVPYNAYFVAGSDLEFAVSPSSGELLPTGTNGSLIKICFKPTKYGKTYQGKLIVQTQDMQWTYNVHGVLPDYLAPHGHSSQPMAGPHPDPRRRPLDKPNFVKENLNLSTTAVSSPIKGAPLLIKQRPGFKLTPVK